MIVLKTSAFCIILIIFHFIILSDSVKLDKSKIHADSFLIQQSQSDSFSSIKLSPSYYDMRHVVGNCTTDNCMKPYGNCTTSLLCTCSKGYANYAITSTTDKPQHYCNYELKSQSKAFILEFMLCFGVGHFYTGRILHGMLKLIFLVSVMIIDFFLRKKLFNKTGIFAYVILSILYVSFFIWQIIDMCLYGMNALKDGNGMPLEQWGEVVSS